MGKGRKKKPDKFKVLQGTFRDDRANPDVPEEDRDKLSAPVWMPAECIEHFLTIKTRLGVYDLDSASWTEAAALIAMRVNEIEECTRQIHNEGRTYASETKMGDPIEDEATGEIIIPVKKMIKAHPAVAQRNEAMRHLQSLLSEFGLTPASISKVSAMGGNKPKQADPWDGMVGNGR